MLAVVMLAGIAMLAVVMLAGIAMLAVVMLAGIAVGILLTFSRLIRICRVVRGDANCLWL
jgi:hypothetical protein